MATVLDLITDALQDLGTVAIDEVPSAEEAANCLRALNAMISLWNTQSLALYARKAHVFDLVSGQSVYTLGTGGDFNMARPRKILDAFARDASGNDFPVKLYTEQQYASILTKSVGSSLPIAIYDDGAYPLRNITVFPVPQSPPYRLVLWTEDAITQFADLNDDVTLPDGYYQALQHNLAVTVAPKYGRAAPPDIKEMAITEKAQIKINNFVPRELKTPDALDSRRPNSLPWLTW